MPRTLIKTATREKRFRPRAVRIDSTVIEADVRYRTDADLASHAVKVLAREGRKLAKLVGEKQRRVRDRSRAMGRALRQLTRTIRRRTGEAKAEVLALTEQTGKLLERSVAETRKLAQAARRRARGRGAKTKLKVAATLEQLADRCEKVTRQIRQRVAGETITNRIVSLSDPDARPIRKGQIDGVHKPATLKKANSVRALRDRAGLDWKAVGARAGVAATTAIYVYGCTTSENESRRGSPRRAIIATLGLAGLRVEELCQLDDQNMNLAKARLHIADAKTQAGVRSVDIHPRLLDELRTYRASRPGARTDEPMFPIRTGTRRGRSNILVGVITPAVARANELRAAQG